MTLTIYTKLTDEGKTHHFSISLRLPDAVIGFDKAYWASALITKMEEQHQISVLKAKAFINGEYDGFLEHVTLNKEKDAS